VCFLQRLKILEIKSFQSLAPSPSDLVRINDFGPTPGERIDFLPFSQNVWPNAKKRKETGGGISRAAD
jgi:hypothetical protein